MSDNTTKKNSKSNVFEKNTNNAKIAIRAYLIAHGMFSSDLILEVSYKSKANNITESVPFSKEAIIKSQGECMDSLVGSAYLDRNDLQNLKNIIISSLNKLPIINLPRQDEMQELYIQLMMLCEQINDPKDPDIGVVKKETKNGIYYFIETSKYKELLTKAGVKPLHFTKYLINNYYSYGILKTNRSTGYGSVHCYSLDNSKVSSSGYMIRDIRPQLGVTEAD